jgi:hypothetical protein
VSHCKLLKSLQSKGVENGLLNLISHWYSNQKINVDFNGYYSEEWYIRNGVRQGGVLSPYFFVLYIDHVIKQLSKTNMGCNIRFISLSTIVFADDFVLLAPTAFALQKLLDCINSEFIALNLTLNPSKCVYMIFKKNKNKPELPYPFVIDGIYINRVNEYKYLGFLIDENISNRQDIVRSRNKFYNVFNFILRKFHYVDLQSFMQIFTAHCMHMYGADLWFANLNCKPDLKKFSIGFHKAIKKIVKVPYYYSNHHVCNSLKILTFDHYINWIQIRFTHRVINSQNHLFLKLQDFFRLGSELSKHTNGILQNYNVGNLCDNDIDSIKARIFFVQANEPSSNAFNHRDAQI